MVKNDPKVIAKLLRAWASGTDAKENSRDVILIAAADLLDPPSEKNAIIAEAYESAAAVFETYASDQIASKRFQISKHDKAACDVRAEIWTDAAAELRRAAAS